MRLILPLSLGSVYAILYLFTWKNVSHLLKWFVSDLKIWWKTAKWIKTFGGCEIQKAEAQSLLLCTLNYIRTIQRPYFLPPTLSIQYSFLSILILFWIVLRDLPLFSTNAIVVISGFSIIKSKIIRKVLSSSLCLLLCLLLFEQLYFCIDANWIIWRSITQYRYALRLNVNLH